MPYPRKFLRRPRRKIIRRRGFSKKAKVARSVKTFVKRQLNKRLEKKQVCMTANNATLSFGNSGASYPYNINLIPSVAMGDYNHQRQGNRIHVRGGYIKGIIRRMEHDSNDAPSPVPMYIRVMVVKALQWNSIEIKDLQQIDDNLFRTTNSSPVGCSNSQLDMCLQINRDAFQVFYDKVHYIGGAGGSSQFDDTSVRASIPFYINWGRHVKKTLHFDYSNNNNNANNDHLMFIVHGVQADGGNDNTYVGRITYANYFFYDDA